MAASLDPEAFHGLAGGFSDAVEILVEMQYGALTQLGCGRDQQIGDRRGAMLSALREDTLHFHGPVLNRGVRYFTGIDAKGGNPMARASARADRAKKPASSRVTVLMPTSPRPMRLAHSSASGLVPSRTSADLSVRHARPQDRFPHAHVRVLRFEHEHRGTGAHIFDRCGCAA